jgi:hypothetical protein
VEKLGCSIRVELCKVQILVVVAIILTRWILYLHIMSSFEDRGGEGFPVNGTHTGVSRS